MSFLTIDCERRYHQTDINVRTRQFFSVFLQCIAVPLAAAVPLEGGTFCPACKPSFQSLWDFSVRFTMRITSELICQAADQLHGFVGLNRKTGQYIVRFSEDSFGMDVADDGIIPASEFVWAPGHEQTMTLKRELIQLLLDQNIDDRINITEPLRVYMQRQEVPEILAVRQSVQG